MPQQEEVERPQISSPDRSVLDQQEGFTREDILEALDIKIDTASLRGASRQELLQFSQDLRIIKGISLHIVTNHDFVLTQLSGGNPDAAAQLIQNAQRKIAIIRSLQLRYSYLRSPARPIQPERQIPISTTSRITPRPVRPEEKPADSKPETIVVKPEKESLLEILDVGDIDKPTPILLKDNQLVFKLFADRLRKKAVELINQTDWHPYYKNQPERYQNDFFAPSDLNALATRYQIPLCLDFYQGNHWRLILKSTQLPDGRFQVLIFDPLYLYDTASGKKSVTTEIYNQDPTNPDSSQLMNVLAADQYREGKTYNLATGVEEDLEVVSDDILFAAKTGKLQFDGINCGPACLFTAAMREAMKPEWNGFKYSGRDLFKNDFKIQIRTREEFFNH